MLLGSEAAGWTGAPPACYCYPGPAGRMTFIFFIRRSIADEALVWCSFLAFVARMAIERAIHGGDATASTDQKTELGKSTTGRMPRNRLEFTSPIS